MSKRLERVHQTGFANIDYRTKQDIKSLEFYQPWKVWSHYGTMNDYGQKLEFNDRKKIFQVTKGIDSQKDVLNESPNPKIYKSAQFYKNNNIKFKTKSLYINDRIAQLDESAVGKDRYVGDSMMIADINKERKERKNKKKIKDLVMEKKEKLFKSIVKEKDIRNKDAIQETQLVKINANVTLEGKVDIKKIKEIRLALRRRYANRTNFNYIFNQWKRSMKPNITLYDAHKMINDLNIPINFNETRALISSANKRGTEDLNLEEFIDLIFRDNQALNVDFNKLQFKDESVYAESKQMDELKENMKLQLIETNRGQTIQFLNAYFKNKKPLFLNKIKELGEYSASPLCEYEVFEKVMKKLNLPQKYVEPELLHAIYDKYKDKETGKMNYINYLDYCLKLDISNNFFDFQKKNVELIKNKVDMCKADINIAKEYMKINNENKEILKLNFEEKIKEDNIKKENEKIKYDKWNYISHYQPSLYIIHNTFDNRKKYYDILNEAEEQFNPSLKLLSVSQRKTRFGANPKNVNTFPRIQSYEGTPQYISEQERFTPICFTNDDKVFKSNRTNAILQRIKNVNNNTDNLVNNYRMIDESKDNLSIYFKANRKLKYDLINFQRNDIIE